MGNKNKSKFFLTQMMVVCAFIVISVATGFSYAKFVKDANMASSGTVATPMVVVGGIHPNAYTFELAGAVPGTNDEYSFNISNGVSDTDFSEVALSYCLTLSTTGYLPLEIAIKDGEGTILASVDMTNKTDTSETNYTFTASAYEQDTFTLSVIWPSATNSADYSGLIDAVTITALWEQID